MARLCRMRLLLAVSRVGNTGVEMIMEASTLASDFVLQGSIPSVIWGIRGLHRALHSKLLHFLPQTRNPKLCRTWCVRCACLNPKPLLSLGASGHDSGVWLAFSVLQ